MNIERKIEEIRRKPEHIRIRYIYGLMAISMFFILLLWFFSFFSANIHEDAATKLKNESIIRDFQNQKKSLEGITRDAKETFDDFNNLSPEDYQTETDLMNDKAPLIEDPDLITGINQSEKQPPIETQPGGIAPIE